MGFSAIATRPTIETSNGLVLYYHPFSFYSQKVLFVLHEKQIDCALYEINIHNGQQCSEWFMELNPKFDIPVLQHNTFVVPSSNQIINYLEENFSDEKTKLLLPRDLDEKTLSKVLHFHRNISRLPIGVISLGSFVHSDLIHWPKLPFAGPLRRGFLESEQQIVSTLELQAERDPSYKDALLTKAHLHKKSLDDVKDREYFLKLINAVDLVLTEVEKQLQQEEDNEWLCCNNLTIADISLGVLLYRLDTLGLRHLWAEKPFLQKYFVHIKARSSFQRTLPSSVSMLKIVWTKTPQTYKIFSLGIIVVIAGIVVYKI